MPTRDDYPDKEAWNRAIRLWLMTAQVPAGGGGGVGGSESDGFMLQEQAPGDMLILLESGDNLLQE